MTFRFVSRSLLLAASLAITSTALAADSKPQVGKAVDAKRILKAGDNNSEWVTHGRTYSEQRYSPLKKINLNTVKNLGLAWYVDLDTDRGQESTPLIIDGTMYFTSAWSKAFAVDARTGKEKWRYDPKVAGEKNADACCDVVNRGVAAWGDKVFLGTLDGRLIALDMATGKEVWSVQTTDPTKRYTITGAPRIVRGKVIIGNGGAELGVRGYVSAYDANSGKMLWRFYTVPGNPAEGGVTDKTMEMAAKTWAGDWWKVGGGGTVWDSMAYDPEFDLLYIGVGNGSPWNYQIRSQGKGDNLFLSSIVALKPDTGEYVWHFQTTPGESWDYTATQHIILADIKLDGKVRKVLMQAPKNGYFYVIDRKTGQFISGDNYVNVSWSTGLDANGRPQFVKEAFYVTEPAQVAPTPIGGHNWYPMSFSPLTNLVYIPALEASSKYSPDPNFKVNPKGWNIGIGFSNTPVNPTTAEAAGKSKGGPHLLAWNPITQTEAWRVSYPRPGNGGVLSTGGNLVVQGSADGYLNVYRADTGTKLWSYVTQNAVMSGPATYELDGEQYIAVMAGIGGVAVGAGGPAALPRSKYGRMLAFKLGGKTSLPPLEGAVTREVPNLSRAAPMGDAAKGRIDYERICASCHGANVISPTAIPDLRYSRTIARVEEWNSIVIDGARKDKGMVSFSSVLKPDEVENVRTYVIQQANAVLNSAGR
jgi:alcohol dehydrogenase (cytochrome c)/quinohemoprotein ethanol dehydrogenase